ncbi:telomerase RNA component interacting RNase [Rhinatrema bivittatum]|uniref:telomerase RNA component interacting RNase n=1 Tax=Rhinatrema bivittatum TaxID=194408 RepID=UPI0011282694|nr:telomerase RNA component interacting RNase [Rhinatrema bivittatum]
MAARRGAAEASRSSGSSGERRRQPEAAGSGINLFVNDGSFLELFKKKMEAEQGGAAGPAENTQPPGTEQEPEKKKSSAALSFVGKRRGGSKLALKTGVVAKKQKPEDEVLASKGDAWAKYMAEVKKYKAHQCSDDDKTRPLVK